MKFLAKNILNSLEGKVRRFHVIVHHGCEERKPWADWLENLSLEIRIH
jgi:hypothetical protein